MTVRQVTPEEAARMVAGGAVMLDVRSAEEWAQARIAGSLHVPLDEIQTAKLPATELVVVCHSGARSHHAAAYLLNMGHQAVNLAGGIVAWHRTGHPIED